MFMVPAEPTDQASTISHSTFLDIGIDNLNSEIRQELGFLELVSNSDIATKSGNKFLGNLSQSALEVFPELLNQASNPSSELLLKLNNPLNDRIALQSPSSFEKADSLIQKYLKQHSAHNPATSMTR